MITQNTFNEGMVKDLNPLTTPDNVLTDALNATLITYNGEEFVLQNDMGNCKVERAKLSTGFIPIGMKEYGGIVYITSYNPETKVGEVGAFPSPERDFSTQDFDNLSPAKFTTDKFVVNTGTEVAEKTAYIQKLVEPELLQLNPGDMYVVTFTINDPVPESTVPDEIDTVTKMNEYISKDVLNRKLFKLKFYKISDDNNLSEMNPDDVKLIENQPDIENEYVFFKEKNKGVIALGLELETLDSFNINVVDTSKKTDETKSAVIEAVGYSDSMADFEGVKVDVILPTAQTFYINKTQSDSKKVSATLSELVADSKLSGSIIPYSKYALYPKLKKDFNLELGKYASAGSDINNIYKYRVNNNSLSLDFDFQFQGNNDNGLTLYVEFYDPWSDYSVIKVVDNPTYYGVNNVVVELIDEPTTEIFNSTQTGGTLNTKLITNNDTSYLKTLLNSTNKIRTTSTLRKNHFYIVRISGVDVDVTQNPTAYKHYDLYKGLYTTTMFNTIYDAQNSLDETSADYVPDFNELDFDISEVKYAVTKTSTPAINSVPVITTQRDDLVTNGKYYALSTSVLNISPGYKYTKLYRNTKNYNLKLSLVGTDKVFGDFRTELISTIIPTLVDSQAATGLKPVITDENYDNDSSIAPESYADWDLNQIDPNTYQLITETTTKRSVYANVETRLIQGRDLRKISMIDQLYYRNNNGPYSNKYAIAKYDKYSLEVVRPNGSIYRAQTSGRAFDDGDVDSAINNNIIPITGSKAAMILIAPERTFFYPNRSGYDHCANRDPGGTVGWKQSILLVRRTDGNWKMTRTHDVDTIIEFFTKLTAYSNTVATLNAYYPSQNVKANPSISTIVDYPTFTITTQLSPTAAGVKTYLSKIVFRASGTSKVNFTTDLINNYIASRKSDSEIINNKLTVRDGFIPFITSNKQVVSEVDIEDTVMTQSADNSIVTKMLAGATQVETDGALASGLYEHGKLFIDDPNYQSYVQYFTLQGVQSTVPITSSNVELRIQNAGGEWDGKNSKPERCDTGDQAPNMLPNIMITKP